jgi:hypothetical protein
VLDVVCWWFCCNGLVKCKVTSTSPILQKYANTLPQQRARHHLVSIKDGTNGAILLAQVQKQA